MNWGSNLKRNLASIIFLAILGSVGIGLFQFWQFNDGKLHLVFCDVGQGDAIYIRAPSGQEVLIDGGPDDRVLNCLSDHRQFYDQEIEVVILSHPEADHLTGLVPVLERYKINYLLLENIFMPTAVFTRFQKAVAEENAKIFNPKRGDRIRLGEVELVFDWPEKIVGSKTLWQEGENQSSMEVGEPNDYSLILEIKYKNFKALLTGDAEKEILSQIASPEGLTVLKVPHHGSKGALSRELLQSLEPKLAVISVGENNRFGHPAQETLEILRDSEIKILRTDKNGEVEIISDGKGWRLN